MKKTYSLAGVNIREGDRFVDLIKPMVRSTFSRYVLSGIGNFGAFFKIPRNLAELVFVASTDGVGTKIKIAIASGKHDTIGEDLVNHCVNDIAVCGASPLFFLDYMAFGKLKSGIAADIVRGLVRGCKENRCSLIGGETAEMPGLYDAKDYDLAGTIIGVVEKKKIIDKKNVRKGDVLIGLASNGLHTNGYSLARKVLLEKYKLNQKITGTGTTLSGALLKVHRSYLRQIKSVTEKVRVHSISHITGGGIIGNTRRVIPAGLKLNIDWYSWKRPLIFDLIQRSGRVDENEMRHVFNLGIGLIFIVSKNSVDKVISILKRQNEKHYLIGEVTN
jgi:phosphoribosylformylglycinamidine cyclo-ligase